MPMPLGNVSFLEADFGITSSESALKRNFRLARDSAGNQNRASWDPTIAR